MTLHAEMFNHSLALALSSTESPLWLAQAEPDFQRKIASITNDILGSGVDLPILVPCQTIENGQSWTAVTLRKLFAEWIDGSGADIAEQLLSPGALSIAQGLQRWCFMPAASSDVIVGAIARQDVSLRQAWLVSLSDHAYKTLPQIVQSRPAASSAPMEAMS